MGAHLGAGRGGAAASASGAMAAGLVGRWSLPDSQRSTSLIGTTGPTLSFAGSMSASRWGTDTIQGRTVNTLRFQRDGHVWASMSGTSIPIGDASRTLAGWLKVTQYGGNGPFGWGAVENHAYYIGTYSGHQLMLDVWGHTEGVNPISSNYSSTAGTTLSPLMTAHRTTAYSTAR